MNFLTRLKEFLFRNKSIIVVFVTAFLLRIVYAITVFDLQRFNQWMPEGFDKRALLLAQGRSYFFPTAWASFHVPLSLLYKLFQSIGALGRRLEIMVVISTILGAIGAVFVFKTSKKLFPKSKLAQFIITALYVIYYPIIYFNSVLLSENLFIPLAIIAFYHIIDLPKNLGRKGIVLGFFLGIATILRPNILSY